jgi:hypothetical protein
MSKRARIVACMMMAIAVALMFSVQPRPAVAEKFIQEFLAVISKDTVKVGESAVVTFSGGQRPLTSTNVPFDWKSWCSVTRTDKMKFKVKGLAPGNAVIKFKNGDKEVVVRVTVVVGGPYPVNMKA